LGAAWVLEGDLIGGGVFSTKIYTDNRLGVMINPYHKQYIYSKIDIDKWHSVKGNHKKINALELAEEEKNKLTGMMTTFLSDEIKGKYTQRLLDLLMQYKGSGFFIMEWDKFKEILEVPKSYRARDIDKQIMEKSKEELEKIGLKITKIEKIKKGRSIETIKIKFDFERKKEEKKQDIKDPVLVEEQAQNTTEFDKELENYLLS
jgi:plasmid replication initiation protein